MKPGAEPRAADRFVVVALFEALPVGATFSRRNWPLHLTLVSNFSTTDAAALTDAIARAGIGGRAIQLTFAQAALFGPARDVPVQLVVPGVIDELHVGLADEIQNLPGFRADSPEYWRDGYRPHVTHTPARSPQEAETWRVRSIAVARLSGSDATIVAASDLPQGDSTRRS